VLGVMIAVWACNPEDCRSKYSADVMEITLQQTL